MKFKFKIKIFKKTFIKKNIIIGTFFYKKIKNNVYLIRNDLLEKIFKNNFLNIVYLNEKISVYIKKIKYKYINNKIDYFELEEINCSNYKINVFNNINNYNKKITFYSKNKFPRKIYLYIYKIKKKIKYSDFNFNFNFKINKIIYFKKNLTK